MAESPSPPATVKEIFILSGQSNMSGRGGVKSQRHSWDHITPPECHPHPSILRFTSHSHWEPARDPLHADIDSHKICGVGPGMPFANALLSRIPESAIIGLVPCAVGGTAIKEWEKGSRLYEDMVRRARAAAEAGGGEIRAVLWFQGESDTESEHAARAYRANMERLIQDVRSDLCLPTLPFIQVALASGEKNHIEEIREAQFAIDLPNVVCVDAKGLPLNEDNLHLTTEAHVLLGSKLAKAYIDNFLPYVDI